MLFLFILVSCALLWRHKRFCSMDSSDDDSMQIARPLQSTAQQRRTRGKAKVLTSSIKMLPVIILADFSVMLASLNVQTESFGFNHGARIVALGVACISWKIVRASGCVDEAVECVRSYARGGKTNIIGYVDYHARQCNRLSTPVELESDAAPSKIDVGSILATIMSASADNKAQMRRWIAKHGRPLTCMTLPLNVVCGLFQNLLAVVKSFPVGTRLRYNGLLEQCCTRTNIKNWWKTQADVTQAEVTQPANAPPQTKYTIPGGKDASKFGASATIKTLAKEAMDPVKLFYAFCFSSFLRNTKEYGEARKAGEQYTKYETLHDDED